VFTLPETPPFLFIVSTVVTSVGGAAGFHSLVSFLPCLARCLLFVLWLFVVATPKRLPVNPFLTRPLPITPLLWVLMSSWWDRCHLAPTTRPSPQHSFLNSAYSPRDADLRPPWYRHLSRNLKYSFGLCNFI